MGDIFGDLFGRGRGPRGGRPQPQRGQDLESTVSISFADAAKGTTLQLTPADGGEAISVRIPAGADSGSRLRVRGKGTSGRGGRPGDLLLTIQVQPHKHFRRDGDDLHLDLPITISEAYSGSQVRVPTPDGPVKLTVPKRTQSGQVLRLRGKGIARASKPRGDLFVRFLVIYESSDKPAVAEAVATLGALSTDPRAGIEL